MTILHNLFFSGAQFSPFFETYTNYSGPNLPSPSEDDPFVQRAPRVLTSAVVPGGWGTGGPAVAIGPPGCDPRTKAVENPWAFGLSPAAAVVSSPPNKPLSRAPLEDDDDGSLYARETAETSPTPAAAERPVRAQRHAITLESYHLQIIGRLLGEGV